MDSLFAGGSGVGESGWLNCTNWPGQSIQIGWRTVTDEKTARRYLRGQHLRMGFIKNGLALASSDFIIYPCSKCQFGASTFLGDPRWDQHHATTGMCEMRAFWYQETQSMSLPCAYKDTDMHTRGNQDSTAVLEYVSSGRVNLKLQAMCRWASFFPLYPSALPQGIAYV